jgi:hypothetical protein
VYDESTCRPTVLGFVNKSVEAVHILALDSKYPVNNERMLNFTLVLFMILQGMSKLSSDRLNVARKGHGTVARAHSYFADIPEGLRTSPKGYVTF